MLFENNYFEQTVNLIKEAFKFKKYKAMPAVLAVFCGIVMLPFVAISLSLFALLYILCFSYKLSILPLHELYKFLHKEGQEVKHATQSIIYFISWPFLFLLYTIHAFTYVTISFIYALFSVFTYIWSFGGFKFHLTMSENADITCDVKGRYHFVLPLILVSVSAFFLLILPLCSGIDNALEYENLRYFSFFFISSFANCTPWYVSFTILYSLIGMAPRPRCNNEIDECITPAETL